MDYDNLEGELYNLKQMKKEKSFVCFIFLSPDLTGAEKIKAKAVQILYCRPVLEKGE